MTTATDLLADMFDRVHEGVAAVLDGIGRRDLTRRIAPEANTIGWLVWHLLRVQDHQVAGATGADQVWTTEGWHERLDLPFPADATGYGQTTDEVGAVDVDPELLLAYSDAVHAATQAIVSGLDESDLARIIDLSYDPPVTVATRLVSVIGDEMKHLGQAEYVRGVL